LKVLPLSDARAIFPVLLTLFLSQLPTGEVNSSTTPTLVVKNVAVIDASGPMPRTRQTVIVRDGKVQEVGANLRVPNRATVIDGSGKYLIPGLWDMHVHLTDARSSALAALVANGVTNVRDMGSRLAELDDWRAQIKIGVMVGPAIIRAGPIVNGMAFGPTHLPIADAAEARGAVRALAAIGVDFIKIHAAVTRDEYFAIADETKRAGLPFVGHIAAGVTPAEASDAGQASIEHTETLFVGTPYVKMPNDQMLAAVATLFDKFAANGTRYTPTLVMYESGIDFRGFTSHPESAYVAKSAQQRMQQAAEQYKKLPDGVVAGRRQVFGTLTHLVGMMHDHGVKIMVGTDLSDGRIFPGFSVHEELALLVVAGLSPIEALRAATLTPAEFLKVPDSGVIAPGKRADLVLLTGNPLADIHNTRRIDAVILRGQLLKRTDLNRLLAESARRAQME
jgi:imidazolonepropionase-like amidohydrolase